MNRVDLVKRVRSMTRDFSNSIFREGDIVDYINESIDRFIQSIPELRGMTHLLSANQSPDLLPLAYHHLLALYSASRCFAQDERHYQSTTFMNEFEVKLEELRSKIESGDIVIVDPKTGEPVETTLAVDYVKNNYFLNHKGRNTFDPDDGVEGVGF